MGVLQGVVVAVHSRGVLVRCAQGMIPCDFRRGLARGARQERSLLAVGDRVTIEWGRGPDGSIREILPRVRRISRLASWRPLREHVIAANIDQLLAVQSLGLPRFNARGLDRMLVLGESGGVRCAVCLNKTDLAGQEEADRLGAPYRRIGYPVFATSAATGLGLEDLALFLRGRETVFLGSSGVGKTALLNRLVPGADLRTGLISAATRKGRHTTTRVDYLELPGGGAVLDTPGIRSIQPWAPASEIAGHFPEMRPHLGSCRFPDCLHKGEPGCAIRGAMARGEIDPGRYDSYVRILSGLEGVELT